MPIGVIIVEIALLGEGQMRFVAFPCRIGIDLAVVGKGCKENAGPRAVLSVFPSNNR